MKKIIVCLFLLILSAKFGYTQDPLFTQTYANSLYLNPAFAGTDNMQRINLNFRDQWPGISGYVTYNISYDRNIIDSNFSIGFLSNRDEAGDNTIITTNASLILAYQFHIKQFTLSAALQGTFRHMTLNQNNLAFGDQIDPTKGFIYYNTNELFVPNIVNVVDFSGGVLGYGKNYFAGFSINHFTQPNESFIEGDPSPLPMKFVFNGGVMIPVGLFTISPTFLYLRQQDFNSEVAECYLSNKHFMLGVGYRFGDAMIFTLGFQSKFLRIGYSYDYTTSALTNTATGGTHELSAAVLLPYKSHKLKKVSGFTGPKF